MASGKHVLAIPKGKHLFGTAKIGEKGQIVIPKEARKLFNINPGDTLLVLGDEKTGIFISKPEVMNEVAVKILNTIDDKDSERND